MVNFDFILNHFYSYLYEKRPYVILPDNFGCLRVIKHTYIDMLNEETKITLCIVIKI